MLQCQMGEKVQMHTALNTLLGIILDEEFLQSFKGQWLLNVPLTFCPHSVCVCVCVCVCFLRQCEFHSHSAFRTQRYDTYTSNDFPEQH